MRTYSDNVSAYMTYFDDREEDEETEDKKLEDDEVLGNDTDNGE